MKTNTRPATLAGRNVSAVTHYPMLGELKGEYRHGESAPRMLKYDVLGHNIEIPAFMVVHEGQAAPHQIWIDVYRDDARTRKPGTPCMVCKEVDHVGIDSSSVCRPNLKK